MKVLLTTLNAKYIHSSLALRYLEKYCKGADYEVIIEEYTINDNIDAIAGSIFKTKADVIAFSCYIWNISMIIEIADQLKKVKEDSIIILGGPEVSYDAGNMLKEYPFIDCIVMGEGEETFKEMLKALADKVQDIRHIKGIAFRDKQGNVVVNEPRPLINNLDSIPFPYDPDDLIKLSGKIIYYETSRGCPFNCSYCLSSTIEGVRFFSMERVKKDLLTLINNNVKQVKFVDRTFNCNKKRAMEIFEFLMRHQKNTSYHFEIAADLLDDEMIEYLSNAPKGLFQFEIGVQSTHPLTIEKIERKTNFNKIVSNVRKLKRAGNIHLHLDLIAGLPEESYSFFEKSFNDVFALSPHMIQLGFLKLLKGSKIRRQAQQYQYRYTNRPPYEVLSNNVMSYSDILKLKGIEDVLEKYYNSGAFEKSLEFILKCFYSSPFKFFEQLAGYFEHQGLDKRSHSRKALYDILYEFYAEVIGEKVNTFTQYLKFDFLYNQRGMQLPYWASTEAIPGFKQKCFDFLRNEDNISRFLPNFIGVPAKKIIKEIEFAVFDFNVLDEEADKEHLEKIIIIFDYAHSKAITVGHI